MILQFFLRLAREFLKLDADEHYFCSFCRRSFLTDAEPQTLMLARRIIDFLPPEVRSRCHLSTQTFLWSPENARSLFSSPGFDIIFGSELMYFRTDIDLLVDTLSAASYSSSSSSSSFSLSSCSSGSSHSLVAILCHVNRVPHGNERLLATASRHHLAVAFVPIHQIFAGESVLPTLELVLIAQSETALQRLFAPLLSSSSISLSATTSDAGS